MKSPELAAAKNGSRSGRTVNTSASIAIENPVLKILDRKIQEPGTTGKKNKKNSGKFDQQIETGSWLEVWGTNPYPPGRVRFKERK